MNDNQLLTQILFTLQQIRDILNKGPVKAPPTTTTRAVGPRALRRRV